MAKSFVLLAAAALSVAAADAALAQPGPDRHRTGQQPRAEQHYYNGRWIGQDEWRQRAPERDHWVREHHRGHGGRDDSAALAAGIIGFALGAAIMGSQAEADRARHADRSFDAYCARRYPHYDRRSRTYLGPDGFRHYCR